MFQLEGPYFYNLLKRRGVKDYVLNEHNVYWELLDFPSYSFKEQLYSLFASQRDKNIEIMALRDATQILVCSERDKRILSENVQNIEDKITIIPNCVDFELYKTYLEEHSTSFNENDRKKSFSQAVYLTLQIGMLCILSAMISHLILRMMMSNL